MKGLKGSGEGRGGGQQGACCLRAPLCRGHTLNLTGMVGPPNSETENHRPGWSECTKSSGKASPSGRGFPDKAGLWE